MVQNLPTAVQFPGDEQDTEENSDSLSSTSSGNCAGCASSQTPSSDVMVNASLLSSLFLNVPTAVQFPGDEHDTDVNCASGSSDWMPTSNCAGRAVSHSPSVDVMVNASLSNVPTAVQFPDDEHDNEKNCELPGSCTGCASSH